MLSTITRDALGRITDYAEQGGFDGMTMTRLEGAYSVLEIGKKKEAEGDLRRAHMAYETAVRDFIHLSVAEYPTEAQLKMWLSGQPFDFAAERFIALTERILEMPKAKWTTYFQNGNYLLVAFSHFFAALGQHERARIFSEIAVEPALFSTPFWGEFSKKYRSLMIGATYTPQFGKLNFLEKYESVYVNLMLAVINDEHVESYLSDIDRQFIARNADERMNAADAYMIEGSPEHPVEFDFRKAGLLATIANTNLRTAS